MRAERRGDRVAYEALLADIARVPRIQIRGRLHRLGMNAEETEDIVQEILIGIHTMRSRWDAERAFLPWLHAIVRYKLTDAVRRRQREGRYRCDLSMDEWMGIAEGMPEPSPLDLDRHLGKLSAGQRDVVQALAVDGSSVRDTAHRLKTSEGAVRVTLHRALRRLAAIAKPATQDER